MPVDGIVWVQVDGFREVHDRVVELEEPVPHQTSSVVSRRVVWIQSQNLIKVFEGQWKPFAANLFSHGRQVVQSGQILTLKVDST